MFIFKVFRKFAKLFLQPLLGPSWAEAGGAEEVGVRKGDISIFRIGDGGRGLIQMIKYSHF